MNVRNDQQEIPTEKIKCKNFMRTVQTMPNLTNHNNFAHLL